MIIGDYKIQFRDILAGLILMVVLFSSCKKFENAYIAVSSKEQKLIAGSWALQSATKDGQEMALSTLCAYYQPGVVDFRTPGEVEVICSLLLPNSRADIGTWELENRKNLEMTLTDSSYYDYINYQWVYVPVTPVKVKWEILKITSKTLRVREVRTDGVYEFIFNTDY